MSRCLFSEIGITGLLMSDTVPSMLDL